MRISATALLLAVMAGAAAGQDTAALLIGGYSSTDFGYTYSTELFGCPNMDGRSLFLSPYPDGNQLGSGVYREDDGSVVVCGGFGETTSVRGDCYVLTGRDEPWRLHSYLNVSVYSHLTVDLPRLGGSEGDKNLIVFGVRRVQN